MDLMPKVYVVHDQQKLNLLPAEQYGEITPCLSGNYGRAMGRRVYGFLRESLRDVKKEDFILPVGNPAYIAMAGAIVMDKLGSMNILQWDNMTQQYIVVEVD